ncbi:MAG: hypothetical protein Q9170_000437 [Blastenia crenularia]
MPNIQHEASKEGSARLRLPMSPLMNPDLQAARNRYKTPKPEPSGELSDFQKRLSKNIYAQALATPVRNCAVTGVRLPNHFLLNFGLTPHPKTDKPWQMPKLAIDPNAITSNKATSAELNFRQTAADLNDDGTFTDTAKPSSGGRARPVAAWHILSTRTALKFNTDLKRKSFLQMIPYRWKFDTRFKSDDIVWRADMDTFVLELMRKKTVRLLKYLAARPAAYVAKCENYADIHNKHQVGAVLWLGKPDEVEIQTTGEVPPPPYAMVKYKSFGHIPIYNIPNLLGPEHTRQLCGSSKSLNGTLAVLKHKHHTIEILMHLWKLMGFVGSDGGTGSLDLAYQPSDNTREREEATEAPAIDEGDSVSYIDDRSIRS